jgi:hypothetical protein
METCHFFLMHKVGLFGFSHDKTSPLNDFAPMQGNGEILNVRYAS